MTTLNGTINATVDILRVSADNGFKDNGFKFRIDDEILAFLGYDRHDASAILRVKANDLTYWHVARAQDGTTAATHTSGATLYAVAEAFATGSDLTPPSPFAVGGATPTLAEVLAAGNDTGGVNIAGTPAGDNTAGFLQLDTSAGAIGAQALLSGSDAFPTGGAAGGKGYVKGGAGDEAAAGGDAVLEGGSGDAGSDDGAQIVVHGGSGAGDAGKIEVYTDASSGPGPLVALAADGKLTFSQAAFVTNGSTVDQLRDSLIAAGLMEGPP